MWNTFILIFFRDVIQDSLLNKLSRAAEKRARPFKLPRLHYLLFFFHTRNVYSITKGMKKPSVSYAFTVGDISYVNREQEKKQSGEMEPKYWSRDCESQPAWQLATTQVMSTMVLQNLASLKSKSFHWFPMVLYLPKKVSTLTSKICKKQNLGTDPKLRFPTLLVSFCCAVGLKYACEPRNLI